MPSIYEKLDKNLYIVGPKGTDTYTVKGISRPSDEVQSEKLVSGEVDGDLSFVGGFLQSKGFVSGSSGWRLSANGDFEGNSGTFRGDVNLGGTNITVSAVGDIQDAIDDVDDAGGGTVFLQPGTYVLTADITVPGSVTLQGVSRDGCIIDGDNAYSVVVSGSDVYSAGTVSINIGDTTVVGSSTTFTAAMVGRYILLDTIWYEITAFTDTTHITIGSAFSGAENLSGSTYVLATVNFNPSVRKLTITNSDGGGIEGAYLMEPNFYDLYIYECTTGIDLDYVVFPLIYTTCDSNGVNLNMNFVSGFQINFSAFDNSTTSHGTIMTNCDGATVFDTEFNDNTGDGINMTDSYNIAFVSLDIFRNGGQGVELVANCDDNQFIAATCHGNTSDGYKFTATCDRNVISACSIHTNGGYGVNIAASTCDSNTIVAPAFSNNTLGNINNQGTETQIIIKSSEGTFGGDGSDGSLSVSSGTTTLDLTNQKVAVFNYSSISITGTGKVAFSNPHATGSVIILKSVGDVTITSSSTSAIDTRAMGAPGGAGGAANGNGSNGTAPVGLWAPTFDFGDGATTAAVGVGGAASAAADLDVWTTGSGNEFKMSRRAVFLCPGAGGGGGAGGSGSTTVQGAGADGGAGGGALLIECAGALNFTTGSIDVSGETGDTAASTAGDGASSTAAGGGGGGGGSGMCIILYNSLTANTGTIIAKGGAGGAGGNTTGTGTNNGDPVSGAGGGGGAGYGGAGGDGAASVNPGASNSNGNAGTASAVVGSGAGGGSGGAADANGSHATTGGAGGAAFGTSLTSFVLKNTFFG